MSQNSLVPSFRFPGVISDPSVPKAVSDALRMHSNALTDIYQAIPVLKQRIDALTGNQGNTTIFNSNSTGGGGGGSFPGLGSVNDLQGIISYTNQPTDNGALLLFGDASAVAVQLTSGVPSPYFFMTENWGAGLVTFTPSSGTISFIGNPNATAMTLAKGYSAILVFDGTNWWAETLPMVPETFTPIAGEYLTGYNAATGLFSALDLPVATDSTLGIVEPDGVTIGIDSGAIYTFVTVDSGPPSTIPVTHGNPFYFDSSLSPWQGWIWFANSWNKFS
jgi:hypothetical protein